MPAKSTSPEAAQKRVWKAELTTLTKNAKFVIRDSQKEINRLGKECAQAIRAAEIAKVKFRKDKARCEKAVSRELTTIARRIGILKGRIQG